MKKPKQNLFVSLTAVFAAFVLGFFFGRNSNHTDIRLSSLPSAVATQSVEPSSQATQVLSVAESSELAVIIPSQTTTPLTEPVPSETTPPSTEPATSEATQPLTESAPSEATQPLTESAPSEATQPLTEPAQPETQPQDTSGLININTATQQELETLPGIGPVLAGRIIEYREAHGLFTSVTQLINVSGIGEKRLAAILDLVTVG